MLLADGFITVCTLIAFVGCTLGTNYIITIDTLGRLGHWYSIAAPATQWIRHRDLRVCEHPDSNYTIYIVI
jgi:hypothetical protein